jgi:hypothetical protein
MTLVVNMAKAAGMIHMDMDPRMGNEPAAARAGTHGVHLRPLGLFGKNYAAMMPLGVLMAHVVFGLVLGLVYAWLV